jgi:hypothetical protein
MMTGEALAFERYRAAKRRYPGARRFSFRETPQGWICKPDYTSGGRTTSVANASSWQQQAFALEQRLLDLQLEAISRTL